MNLWLDDMRPAPLGWLLVTNIEDAKARLQNGDVEQFSMDHDLGACPACMKLYATKDAADWLVRSRGTAMPNCTHVGTGHTLVRWMVENDIWPSEKPTVHSANPVGAKMMREDIERYWHPPIHEDDAPLEVNNV